ncbi:MAG TPA: hypothetical protein VKV15_28485, partial [Bryobacteraceae bacterium]|nr:hypothetical protein [Bryobacteraceae bacterium]
WKSASATDAVSETAIAIEKKVRFITGILRLGDPYKALPYESYGATSAKRGRVLACTVLDRNHVSPGAGRACYTIAFITVPNAIIREKK